MYWSQNVQCVKQVIISSGVTEVNTEYQIDAWHSYLSVSTWLSLSGISWMSCSSRRGIWGRRWQIEPVYWLWCCTRPSSMIQSRQTCALPRTGRRAGRGRQADSFRVSSDDSLMDLKFVSFQCVCEYFKQQSALWEVEACYNQQTGEHSHVIISSETDRRSDWQTLDWQISGSQERMMMRHWGHSDEVTVMMSQRWGHTLVNVMWLHV